MTRAHNYIPPWLDAIMSDDDRAIAGHREARFLAVDPDGVRLPSHQQWIESPAGSMWIDSQKKTILGYGPAVARLPSDEMLSILTREDPTFLHVARMEAMPIIKLVVTRPGMADVAARQEGQTEIESFHITLARLDDMGITKLPNADQLPEPPRRLALKEEVLMVETGEKCSCFAALQEESQELLKNYLRKCEAVTGVTLLDPDRVFHVTLSNSAGGSLRGSIGDVWKFEQHQVAPAYKPRARMRP